MARLTVLPKSNQLRHCSSSCLQDGSLHEKVSQLPLGAEEVSTGITWDEMQRYDEHLGTRGWGHGSHRVAR